MFGATKIEMRILSHLRSGRKMYGLEMVKASDGDLKRGTVYVYLGRMEEKEWIKSEAEKEASMSGLPRRRYWITGLGAGIYDRAKSSEDHFASWDNAVTS